MSKIPSAAQLVRRSALFTGSLQHLFRYWLPVSTCSFSFNTISLQCNYSPQVGFDFCGLRLNNGNSLACSRETGRSSKIINVRSYGSRPATKELAKDWRKEPLKEAVTTESVPVYIPPEMLGHPLKEDSQGIRILKWIARHTGFYSRKNIFTSSSVELYASLIDQIDYAEFFEECELPDTLQSWFLVAHLHLWMMMVRLKREEEGQFVIKWLVKLFWEDVQKRMQLIRVNPGKTTSESLHELIQQFYGLILAYEEGLVSNDKVLAAAIWRNFTFDQEDTDPVILAKMVDYIRRQVLHMDSLSATDLMVHGRIQLLPLKSKKAVKQY